MTIPNQIGIKRRTLKELNAFANQVIFGNKTLATCSRRELLEIIAFITDELRKTQIILEEGERRQKAGWLAGMARYLKRKKSVATLQPAAAPDVPSSGL